MEFLIITGMSGAGKTRAADALEDLNYYCVDNMPVALMPRFAELCMATRGRYEKVALVTDVREKESFDELLPTLEAISAMDFTCRILYMDADVPTLIRRYKESRRPHPLSASGVSIEQAVKKEESLLAPIRDRADFIIDSSHLTLGQLQSQIFALFAPEGQKRGISVTVMSFGYKYGLPMEADLVFDVRFLPNPFYVDELREQSGLDRSVAEFVFSFAQSRSFLEQIEKMFDFLLPYYIEEGKVSLTIGIGCTGGRHRSVAIAAELTKYLNVKGIGAVSVHRDMER